MAPWTPFRWPSVWKDPAGLTLLKGAGIDYLLIDNDSDLEAVRSRARQEGFRIAEPNAIPSGITVVKGLWPGVHMARSAGGQVSAGPTGAPWIDSNGWKIRLSAAFHPESAIWVDAALPEIPRITGDAYLIAIADCAAHGGRWIISLDPQLASGLGAQKVEALETWNRIKAAAGFFAAHKDWAGYDTAAAVGIVSDFSGPNEFFSQELLNLLARAGQHFRVLRKASVAGSSLEGLRALIYADAEPPVPELRKQILSFVEAGGMLITVPKWGAAPGAPVSNEAHPRYSLHAVGKGRIAQANADPDDPYMMANDSAVLVSHRYDLVRFWNGGATGSFYTVSLDRKKAIVHLLFYANRGPDSASVRIAGRYRAAKAATVDAPALPNAEVQIEKDAVEVHLPQVSQYVALELEV